MKKKQLMIVLMLILVSSSLLIAQTAVQSSDSARRPVQRILEEEQEFIGEIEVRVPEEAVLPRKKSEEIQFSLGFIRQQVLDSNRSLY